MTPLLSIGSPRVRARLALSLIAPLAVASCTVNRQPVATEPPPPPVAETAPVVEAPAGPDLDGLYARLDEDGKTYLEGLELITEGEEVMGEALIAQASEGLAAGTEICELTQGCDIQRFHATLDMLLSTQNIALKQAVSKVRELEAGYMTEEETREPGTSPYVASMPEIQQTVSLLRGTDLREMIALNGPVNAALDDWLTWMRPMLMDAYVNYQYLRSDIAPIYEQAGLPEALLFAMIATESGGKVHAYSRAGAAGPLQFMRRTGRVYGLGVDDGFDMRLDPASATRANVAYLNDRFEELNDSLEKALAAYNGGEGRMRSLNRRHGGASLWDSRVYYSLPRETREYVPRVLAAAWLFLHPEDYNLEWPVLETERTTLVVRDETALGELTICLGQEGNEQGWFRTLRNLNPRLEPGERIEPGTEIVIPASLAPVYEERCADGELMDRARALHEANYPDGAEFIPYIVRRGDTLGKIASRNRCASIAELAALNNIRAPKYLIRVGQELKVPNCG